MSKRGPILAGFVILIIPALMLSTIFILSDVPSSSYKLAMILIAAAVFPLIIMIPLAIRGRNFLPSQNSLTPSQLLFRYRIVSFLIAFTVILTVGITQFFIKGNSLRDVGNIIAAIVGVFVFGHILAYILELSEYRIRSFSRIKFQENKKTSLD